MKYTKNQVEEIQAAVLKGEVFAHGLNVRVIATNPAGPQWRRIEITFPDGTTIQSVERTLAAAIALGITLRGGEVS
jgi:hypothetical protein